MIRTKHVDWFGSVWVRSMREAGSILLVCECGWQEVRSYMPGEEPGPNADRKRFERELVDSLRQHEHQVYRWPWQDVRDLMDRVDGGRVAERRRSALAMELGMMTDAAAANLLAAVEGEIERNGASDDPLGFLAEELNRLLGSWSRLDAPVEG